MGLGLAVVAAIVVMAMSSVGKGGEAAKVTLDDVVDPPKKTKKQMKKKLKEGEDEEWEDEGMDKDALYEEIDKCGPYVKNVAGVLEPESLIKLKQLMAKYTYMAFRNRREELLELRLDALRANRLRDYNELVFMAGDEYEEYAFHVTKLAAEFIDLDEENYEASMREAYADP